MAQDFFKDQLAKTYERLFKEIEEFRARLKTIDLHRKNRPLTLMQRINNSDTSISVITPAYNAEKFLPQLYRSLRNQSVAKHVEWVIVDDCSNDNSMEFYGQLGNDKTLGKISIYRNEVNLGAAMSLKRGFSLASSDVFAWVSADDFYVSENKLEKDLQLIDGGLDIVFSKYTIFGTDLHTGKKVWVPSRKYNDNHHMFAEILINNYLNGSSVCIRKDAYLQSGGMNEFLINVDGDFDLWARNILLGKKIGFSNTVVFNCQHPGQTSRMTERMAVGINITRLSYIRFLKQVMERERFEDFSSVICTKYHDKYCLKDSLAFVLSVSKFFDSSDTKLAKKVRTYFLRNLIWNSIWLEELTGKQHRFTHFLDRAYHDFFEMHLLFRNQIYELSDEFMKTESFGVFAKKYREISNISQTA